MRRTVNILCIAVSAATLTMAARPALDQGGRGGGPDQAARAAAMEARITEAAAAPTPKTPGGHPDLTGYWTNAAGGGDPFGSAPPKLAADGKTQVLALPSVATVNRGDVANAARRKQNANLRPAYKPEYAAKA